ncbi:putative ABC transport system permease protein [Dysgonomonas hofstadii]|uniref:Putative ABC transport system permease protein n=2 Tax=Dysgonomonas hofstadii TaxID=637886 RepID=A0A840CPV3_9BACT|nr:putative ABC transport system permease protein [Dysgonomonas hofstadii]
MNILKIIWSDRKINFWILLELTLAFCILWFCVDYLYFMAKRYLQPLGFDIEHTYNIELGIKDDEANMLYSGDSIQKDQIYNNFWTIYDRVKRHPAIEAVTISTFATPYGMRTSTQYMIDSVEQDVSENFVSPEYFDVFKIKKLSGLFFTWDDAALNYAVISADHDGLFAQKIPQNLKEIQQRAGTFKVSGVADRKKFSEFDDYKCVVYTPLKRQNPMTIEMSDLSVRVKPDADKNFAGQFVQDMDAQLDIHPFYLSSVIPIKENRENYLERRGYDGNLKSVYAISLFLLANIFLIVIGSFWFRIQSRRSEIGLRIALGSSKKNIKQLFIFEALSLLFISSILAAFICINISFADILKDIGVPIPERGGDLMSINQYIINYIITFIFISFIVVIAVWNPANRASGIQPAMALHEE